MALAVFCKNLTFIKFLLQEKILFVLTDELIIVKSEYSLKLVIALKYRSLIFVYSSLV